MSADLIARLRAGTVTPADLDAAADALEKAEAEAEARAYARAAAIGYMICAKTRHVSLGNEVEAAIRALAKKEAGE